MHHRTRQTGMTMTELIVAVAVMSLMVLGFGQIIGTSQEVVSSTQKSQRKNNVAQAIGDIIRNDLKKITKNGFLCICKRSGTSFPMLIFSQAGRTSSLTTNNVGLGSICAYTLAGIPDDENLDEYGIDTNKNMLLRQNLVLVSGVTTGGDVLNYDLSSIQTFGRIGTYDNIVAYVKNTSMPVEYSWPPVNLADLQNAWQVLGAEVNNVSIEWTDGTKDASQNLNWYGIIAPSYGNNPKNSGWEQTLSEDISQIEFDETPTDTALGGYQALWTHTNQNNWPKAIRVSFQVHDPGVTEGSDEGQFEKYEVIVPIE